MKTPLTSHSIAFLAVLLGAMFNVSDSYRILAIFPHFGKSHFDIFEPYLDGLAARGHEVVVLSHFPKSREMPNYRDISIRGSLPGRNFSSIISIEDAAKTGIWSATVQLGNLGVETCKQVLKYRAVQQLIHSNETFDLIVIEAFNTDCFLGFVHKFKVPFIAFSSCVIMPWGNDRFGNPDNPSYIPNSEGTSTDAMNLYERIRNTFDYIFFKVMYHYYYDIPSQRIARKYFGATLPPLAEIARNTSLMLVNSHFSLNRPRPLVPAVVEVGGIHIKSVRTLQHDLERFLNESVHGVIYFSMGSMLKADTFPEDKRRSLMEAFSEIPQDVLMKWGSEAPMEDKPRNVRTEVWMPQFDILNHPNVLVFLGHGGLLGVIEAVHSGVPMICTPMYGDQFSNARILEAQGMAVRMPFEDITKETVLRALNTVLTNPSYRENARRMSSAYRDRPMSPLETAVYWTEYVVRHGGSPHMRSAVLDLTWFQYLLLDVAVVAFLALVVVISLVKVITSVIVRKLNTGLCKEKLY